MSTDILTDIAFPVPSLLDLTSYGQVVIPTLETLRKHNTTPWFTL